MSFEEYKHLAQQHRGYGDWTAALSMYRKIEEVAPGNWENHAAIGDMLTALEDWPLAIEAYQASIALKPDFDWAHYNLAMAFLRLEETASADQALKQLSAANPDFGHQNRADFQVQRSFGDHYFRLEKWEKAVAAYRLVIESNSAAYFDYLNIARALSHLDRIADAIPLFEKAKELDPNSVWPDYYLAEFYAGANETHKAEEICSSIVSSNNQFPWAYHLKGQILHKTNRLPSALQCFQQAIAIKPDLLDARQAIGEIHIKLARWEEAIACFEQLIKISPNAYFAHCGLAEAYSRAGAIESAIDSYQKALDLNPKAPEIASKLRSLQQMKESPYGKEINQLETPATHQTPRTARRLLQRSAASDRPPLRIAIKISAPDLKQGCQWGDFHYANSLMKAFERQGHVVRVDCIDAWYTNLARKDDIVIVLRGRRPYETRAHQTNFIWMISHPDRPTDEELNSYDHVFVASYEYAQKVSERLSTQVSCMYQCTDPDVFYPPEQPEAPFSEVLFVGSSRKVFRPVVKNVVELDINLSVYGPFWEEFIPDSLIKGTYIQNNQLNHYYTNSSVLLNDHWDTMRDEGFLSNRLFDASASEAFVITDAVVGIERVFGDLIETYQSPEELQAKITHYTNSPELGREKARQTKNIVLNAHTFDHRAEAFLTEAANIRREKTVQLEAAAFEEDNINTHLLYRRAKAAQLAWFHDNAAALEHGIRNTYQSKDTAFYDWIWRIDWQNPSYKDSLANFIESEHKLIGTLSNTPIVDRALPLVSIVMPTFNRAYVIADGIQSVLDQTYQNWELLICDDGSTDNTIGVVQQFEDDRIRYFQLPKGNGPVARNFGLKYASGDYIAYLDSDNIWHPQHVFLCIQQLLKNPYAMSCYTGYVDVELVKTKIDVQNVSCQSFEYYKLLNRNFIDLNSLVHRYELFEWLEGFDTALPRLQDWDLALRYTHLFEPLVIEHYSVFYRRNIAWSQVTKLYSGLDIRSIVQNKALSNLQEGTMALQHSLPLPHKLSILCPFEHWEDLAKSVAIARSLTAHIQDIQLVIVGKKVEMSAFGELENISIVWIDAAISAERKRDADDEIASQEWFVQLVAVSQDRATITASDNTFWIKVTLLLRYICKQPVIVSGQGYQRISSMLNPNSRWKHLLPSGPSELMPQSASPKSLATRLDRPPLLLSEIVGYGEPRQAMIAGPTIANSEIELDSPEDASGKVELGFSKKDFVIAFWDKSSAYSENNFIEFRRQFDSDRCKIIWIHSHSTVSGKQEVTLQKLSEGIVQADVGNEHQATHLLRGADVCVLWEAACDLEKQAEIPSAFIYSLVSGCVPVLPMLPEFQDWCSYNYARSVPSKNWEALVTLCQQLHRNPRKIAKLKKGGRRLFDLRFSPAVTAERIKPLLLDINKTPASSTDSSEASMYIMPADTIRPYSLEKVPST